MTHGLESIGMLDFTTRHLTMDLGSKCTLECSKCLRQHLKAAKRPILGKDITPDQFKKLINYFRGFSFCGQVSDPIFNVHFHELLKMCYDANKFVSVHSAASQRSKAWYKKAFETNPNARWIVGIDGLPYQSFLYRKNQDGEHLFEMMKMGVKMGVRMAWQYIVFSYNEDNVEKAKQLAKENNIHLRLIKSGRWDTGKDRLKPDDEKYYHKNSSMDIRRAVISGKTEI